MHERHTGRDYDRELEKLTAFAFSIDDGGNARDDSTFWLKRQPNSISKHLALGGGASESGQKHCTRIAELGRRQCACDRNIAHSTRYGLAVKLGAV
jgi:hypothetical protein